jgi:Fe2+ or Zn2+ uptake regulation protein
VTDVHSGSYRFECLTCNRVDDIDSPSLAASVTQVKGCGWRLGVGRNKFRDTCPDCAKRER